MIIIVGDIIGCLSSIITIEEAGRTWIKEMKEMGMKLVVSM